MDLHMIEPVLILFRKLDQRDKLMIVHIGDSPVWIPDRDVCQVFMKIGMGGLDDGEGVGGDILERIVPIMHWVIDGKGSI